MEKNKMLKNSEVRKALAPEAQKSQKDKMRANLRRLLTASSSADLTKQEIDALPDAHLADYAVNRLHGTEVLNDNEQITNGKIVLIEEEGEEQEAEPEPTTTPTTTTSEKEAPKS